MQTFTSITQPRVLGSFNFFLLLLLGIHVPFVNLFYTSNNSRFTLNVGFALYYMQTKSRL